MSCVTQLTETFQHFEKWRGKPCFLLALSFNTSTEDFGSRARGCEDALETGKACEEPYKRNIFLNMSILHSTCKNEKKNLNLELVKNVCLAVVPDVWLSSQK